MVNKAVTQSDTDNPPPLSEEAKVNGGGQPIDTGHMLSDAKETATPTPPKQKEHKPPNDALDLDSLWLDPSLGDGLVDTHYHSIAIGKPKNFFRVNPDPAYRRLTEIYTHKVDGVIDEQYFIIGPEMRGRFEEATPCTIVTVVYRDGTPRLWALKLPKGGGRDNEAWMSARAAARTAMGSWVKLVWVGRAYQTSRRAARIRSRSRLQQAAFVRRVDQARVRRTRDHPRREPSHRARLAGSQAEGEGRGR